MTRPRTLAAAALVKDRPGISRLEVSRAMSCSLSTAACHLLDARYQGLIYVDGRGRYARWWPSGYRAEAEHPLNRRVASVWELSA